MSKSGLSPGARRKRSGGHDAIPPTALEGLVEEICHDMAVHVKRTRQLQEQADELRTVLRQWAGAPAQIRT
jgi:hypothetical protein